MHQLTTEQEQQLSHWLVDKAPHQTLCLNAVKGFLFAIIASPDPIDVNDWLPVIFNDSTDDIPDEITMILAQLYNHTSDLVFEEGYKLPIVTEFSDMTEANFLSGHPLHEWSYGFACGVNFYSNLLLDNMEEGSEILETFTLAIMAMTYFADREMAQEVVDSQTESNINSFSPVMYSMIEDLVGDFAKLVEQAALSTGKYDNEEGDDWEDE